MIHTPGPWYVKHGWKIVTVSNRKTASKKAFSIAEVYDCENGAVKEYEANSKLIAASPLLLEACQAMIARNVIKEPWYEKEYNLLKDAINKALY